MPEPITSADDDKQDSRPVYQTPQVVELSNICEAKGGNPVCGVGSSPQADCTTGAAF
jgi:hypothetical protein